MAVDREVVEQIAALARLQLEPDEAQRLVAQLNDILRHFAALQTVDVANAEPFAVATQGAAPLRPDLPDADTLERDIGDMAPAWVDGFFTVPRLAAQRSALPETQGQAHDRVD